MGFITNQKDYAAHQKVHTSRVTRWRKAGKLKGAFKMISGKPHYDIELADKCVADNVSQIQRKAQAKVKKNPPTKKEMTDQVKKAGTGKLSLSDSQKIIAQYKAALIKIEYEEKIGTLVKAEAVEIDFFNIARQVRDAILNVPDRISAELSSMTDQHTVNQLLVKELNAALERLSK